MTLPTTITELPMTSGIKNAKIGNTPPDCAASLPAEQRIFFLEQGFKYLCHCAQSLQIKLATL